jgi:protein SCO1/2
VEIPEAVNYALVAQGVFDHDDLSRKESSITMPRCQSLLALTSGAIALCLAVMAFAQERGSGSPERDADVHHAEQAHVVLHPAVPGEAPLPDRSIYQLEGAWTNPRGGMFRLAELRGKPVLVLLFYGTCEHACPILVHDLEEIEGQLAPSARAELRFLLVTFDPKIDTPQRLVEYADEKGLDPSRWLLPHGTPQQIRALSLVLGSRYRPIGSGQFSHTSRISLLDREGVVVAQIDGLNADAASILEPLQGILAEPSRASSP